MPRYRLLVADTTVWGSFDAASDEEASRRARVVSRGFQRPHPRFGSRGDLRLEKYEDGHWRCVLAWVPAY